MRGPYRRGRADSGAGHGFGGPVTLPVGVARGRGLGDPRRGQRLTGALLQHEVTMTAEGERRLTGHQLTYGLTHDLGPPAHGQTSVRSAAQEHLEIGAGGQEGGVDLEVPG